MRAAKSVALSFCGFFRRVADNPERPADRSTEGAEWRHLLFHCIAKQKVVRLRALLEAKARLRLVHIDM
jgi:hypothetical protein